MNLDALADGLISRCTCGAWVWAATYCTHLHPYPDDSPYWADDPQGGPS